MTKPVPDRELPQALPLMTREACLITRLADDEAAGEAKAKEGERRYRVTASTGAAVKRWGYTPDEGYGRYLEELVISAEAIDMTRLAAGAPLLDSHNAWSLDMLRGRTENPKIEGGVLRCDIVFPPAGIDEDIDRAAALVDAGTIRFVSLGYTQDVVEIIKGRDGEMPTHRVTRWTPMELSLVAMPADSGAAVDEKRTGAEGGTTLRTFPVEFVRNPENPPASRPDNQEDMMSRENDAGTPAGQTNENPAAAPRAAAPALSVARSLQLRRQAVALGVAETDADAILTRDGVTEASANAAILEAAAARSAAAPQQTSRVQVLQDEGDVLRRDFAGVLASRLSRGAVAMPESAGERREFGLTDFAAALLGHTGRMRTWGEREQVLTRAFHTVSDFPAIYENVLNKSIAARYAVMAPTYRELAVRRDFQDFRPHPIVRPGDFPNLQAIGEGGEIKFGTFGEKKEQASVAAYAVGVRLSREMMVNDDLGAIADVLSNQGDMIALFEDQLFFALLLSNSGAGPALLEGAASMFTSGRGNLAGTGTAITVAALGAGRAAMRKMTSVGGQMINVPPSILLVGPDKELEAQQVVAPVQAAQASQVQSPFASLRIVASPRIAGNAWYLFAAPSLVANFLYGYLNGYEAPRVRVENPFGTQGSALSVEHDFGVAGTDFRGAYRNPGA